MVEGLFGSFHIKAKYGNNWGEIKNVSSSLVWMET
jgi:hypothetical protein